MALDSLIMKADEACDLLVSPGELAGSIAAIPSKSYAQRIYIAAALADAPTRVVRGEFVSDDMQASLSALSTMGARFDSQADSDVIYPLDVTRPSLTPQVNCRESGTVARLLLPILTALFDAGSLTGEGSLPARPFKTLCKTLEQNPGTNFDQYKLPLKWKGRLQAGRYRLRGDESSQYLSGLLFALPLLPEDSEIELTTPLQSAGYVDMTLEVLSQFGITVDRSKEGHYRIEGRQRYRSPGELRVEGDWSNSAFWLAAGIEVRGLNPDSLQRDREFLQLKGQKEIDATDVPDLVPILSVYAALHEDITCIQGIRRLRIKESDRIQTSLAMLDALGYKAWLCEDCGDELYIQGIRGGTAEEATTENKEAAGSIFATTFDGGTVEAVVDGANDHRIVMAAAIAASFAQTPVKIKGAQAVAKTYAHFFEDFKSLGGIVHVI